MRNEPGTAPNARGEDLAIVRAASACRKTSSGLPNRRGPSLVPVIIKIPSQSAETLQGFEAAVLGSVCSKIGRLDLKLG